MALYSNNTKHPGKQPSLGLQANGKLKRCAYEPNCFSTSGDEEHLLPPWRSKAGRNAMSELVEAINAYPPYQARIDGGGFSVVTSSEDYIYVQFESLKNGFIDDVEFFVHRGGEVQVRSSSRLGFLDLGVNAKRLNWISAYLRAKGWTAPAVSRVDFPEYYVMMPFTFDDYIRSELSPVCCDPICVADVPCRR